MALRPLYLADKSALARVGSPAVSERIGPLLTDGLIATCPIVDLEVLYSARSASEYEEVLAERRALPTCAVDPDVTTRALEVQRLLARSGRHRVPLPDLLIAATAEVHDLSVLHYDADFDAIAEASGQRAEWVVPRGSL